MELLSQDWAKRGGSSRPTRTRTIGRVWKTQATRDEPGDEREAREREFWDDHAPSVEDCLEEYGAGPDAMTAALLDAAEPLEGARVLDFACGTGITSALLADRGAKVTGLDLSPQSTARAAAFCRAAGADVAFVTGPLESQHDLGTFSRIVGRFALHHVDVAAIAPTLAGHLHNGGLGVFLETMDSNPLLRVARRHLVGRFGIPRFGTLDEHPLTRVDLAVLERAFGELEVRVPRMTFLRIFDRQVLRHRSRLASRAIGALDDLMTRFHLDSWSYHQLLVLRRSHEDQKAR
jgi:2-polyprenyl-3-methyl-5-hydroxy-6-metoxy-1,4-benzoquinol methylase